MTKMMTTLLATLFVSALLAGCAPEAGSDAWCDDIKAKSTGDVTTNEAADFAKHCLLK